MSSISLIASFSFAVAVLPLLGFPRSWEEILFIMLGLASFLIALSLRRTLKPTPKEVKDAQATFVENVESTTAAL